MVSVEEVARSFSLYNQETMRDPHSAYDQLRSKCPVAHSDMDDGFYIVTKYDDVAAVTRDTDTFSSREVVIPKTQFGPEFKDRPPVTADPPLHARYRRLLLPAFTQVRAQKWEPTIRKIVQETLEPLRGTTHCDVARVYAKRIPLRFMCALMGVPSEMEDKFTQWAHDCIESIDQDAMLHSVGELGQFLGEQVARRVEQPTDDLISTLMATEVDGWRLEGQDLVALLMVVLLAGLDTTWTVLSSTFLHLATHPEDRRRLVSEPELIPTAVEEALRFYSPVALSRETTRDARVGGVTIPAESMVLLSWPAANRDPDAFPDADKFVVDRAENRHIAFGSGIHRCVGAPIARLELRIALEEWLQVIPEFELEDPDSVTFATGHVWGPRTVRLVYPPA
ncbi:cytochrome P450 [Mycobacterium saskatchewanense]|uniref:Cytochrome P450 n=1 Tax=Mycobacterium saskatchewanense TaxID=220927 RepID=A0AAJ3NRR8_9MYCO|nr:cytochrome P450 [Mycobacterium saskatchewanense]ORW72928.1 hypothetical protein AWC23_08720 [Mycobacterium saskatchewanense]BBX62543.1 cytochrome P450 [Mycobacterium saskatchewanense]